MVPEKQGKKIRLNFDGKVEAQSKLIADIMENIENKKNKYSLCNDRYNKERKKINKMSCILNT